MFRLVVLILVAIVVAAAAAREVSRPPPRTFYVDPAGDDEADGRSEKSGWRTLGRVARERLFPGDRVVLRRGGVWRESLVLGYSGTLRRPIEIADFGDSAAAPPEITARDESGKSVRKFCIEMNQDHVRLRHLRLTGASADGAAAVMVYAYRDLADIAIEGCQITGNESRGIWIAGRPDKRLRSLVIAGNEISDNGGSGIILSHGEHALIWDNVLSRNCRIAYEPWQAAIRAWSRGVAHLRIERNVIRDQTWGHRNTSAVGIHVDETGPGVIVAQNDVRDVDHFGIEVENTRGVRVEFNMIVNAEIGVFAYRAGHDHVIRRNSILNCRSQGIALQGHRAGGVNAGPEIEVGGKLFSGNVVEQNIAIGSQWGSLKCVGGAENGVTVRRNAFGIPREGLIEWGDAMFSDYESWERAAGKMQSVKVGGPYPHGVGAD